MLGAVGYKTKKQLKESIGQPLRYVECSIFKPEYQHNGQVVVVGPNHLYKRDWYAVVEIRDGKIAKVN